MAWTWELYISGVPANQPTTSKLALRSPHLPNYGAITSIVFPMCKWVDLLWGLYMHLPHKFHFLTFSIIIHSKIISTVGVNFPLPVMEINIMILVQFLKKHRWGYHCCFIVTNEAVIQWQDKSYIFWLIEWYKTPEWQLNIVEFSIFLMYAV